MNLDEALERYAFSILERIVVVETGERRRDVVSALIFQYPRTDRGG